ncbi:fructose-1,6-bisphosphatase [Treponema parvum]|uniref:Fructose-1,6-bisphosphatase n=1 Tax=Treponema parvum TaxID=138851 RepID=A0A975F5H2_9SPIR|nr:fructose-1,6-bisphosphatase [Treponema parvum]QTQ14856.1 fructose-1,6-bisphosphatase [Treponema parvum]
MEDCKKYLKILARQYPSERAVITKLVNTQSVLNLPKGTEHFLTDIHGEYEQFNHVLKNGSGSIWQKIEEVFGFSESEASKKELATLIYYPRERLELERSLHAQDINDWYTVILHRLVLILRRVSSKYTRSHVRKLIPQDYSYIIEELTTEKEEISDKKAYYSSIIATIIRIGAAEEFIITFCNLIQKLVIYKLHIIGDIFDRGPSPHLIMDKLLDYHSVDIQWGNHDIVWMGAAAGSKACIANVLRMSAKYKSLDLLIDGYGINLTQFFAFAAKVYKKSGEKSLLNAAAMIQFKLEGQIILEHPEFEMNDRLFFDTLDVQKGTVKIEGKTWKLNSADFPTFNPKDPYSLTSEEEEIMNRLRSSFLHSEKLQKHVHFLFTKGSIYKIYNGNLLYHGCVPLAKDGSFAKVNIYGKEFSGKALYDELEIWARRAFFSKQGSAERQKGEIMIWYLWTGPYSPMFGKNKMATFERMFVEEDEPKVEEKNTYYKTLEDPEMIKKIFAEFGIDYNTGHIINGHVPQKVKKGETPIKCGGKLLIIDGGFSAAYHEATGIAGYTLVSNSRGIRLVVHKKFENTQSAIMNETDIASETITVETFAKRKFIADTEHGQSLKEFAADLEELLEAYRDGSIPYANE